MATKRATKKSKKPAAEPEAAAPAVVNEPKAQPPAAPQPAPEPAPLGLEVIDREDMVIPRFSVLQAQPAQKMGVKPGGFLDKLSDEIHETLPGVVLLRVTKGRVYFAEMEDGGGVICASDDRQVPASRIAEPVQAGCAGCPRAQWHREGGHNEPPDCAETFTFLVAYDGMPYFITFKSGAIKSVKKLLTQLTLKARKEKRPAFGYEFDLKTELVEYSGGTTAFQPVFSGLKANSKDDLELYTAMYEAFAHAQPTFDDEPQGGGGDGGAQEDFPFGDNEQ